MSLFYRRGSLKRIIQATGGQFRSSLVKLDIDLHDSAVEYALRCAPAGLLAESARDDRLKSIRGSAERLLKALGTDNTAPLLAEVSIDPGVLAALRDAHGRLSKACASPPNNHLLLAAKSPIPLRRHKHALQALQAWTPSELVRAVRILRAATIDASEQNIQATALPYAQENSLQWLVAEQLPALFEKHFQSGSRDGFTNACLKTMGIRPKSSGALKKHRKRRRESIS